MTKQTRNKTVTVVAVLLMAVAVFLTVMLLVSYGESDKKSDTKASTAAVEESATDESVSATFAPAKYLWEYGPDSSKFEKPSKLK